MTIQKPATKRKKAETATLDDEDALKGTLRHLGGSRSDRWNHVLASQAVATLWTNHSDKEMHDRQISATLDALVGIEPNDEIEGMIVAQLLAAHNAAMECYRRAMIGEQTFEGRRENLTQANKLSRSFAVLVEALNRHRGKGQQKVTVEHVHVHSGGQAVVGMVDAGGGAQPKSREQPHAIAYARDEMPGPNPTRATVPSTSDAQRTLSDARRNVARRPKG